MFIQTEATPNPATLKFIPGRTVLGNGSVDFRSPQEASNSPLAARLFEIDGVTGVFLGSDFISVTKGEPEWQHLKPATADYVKAHYHFDGYGCGLCQVGVPCEAKIPTAEAV